MRQFGLCAVIMSLTAFANAGDAGGAIVDMKNVDPHQYQIDVQECEAYANQVQTGEKVLQGAAAGAVVAGAVGAIFDGGDGLAKGAGSGAVVGGAQGVGRSMQERRQVVRNCLRNRGYAVLN